jgi:HTH-type transcriptional regulator/antitoxin HipB
MTAEFAIRTSDQLTGLLQAYRTESGLTQSQVAERMGLTQQKLSHLERYAQNASAERLLALLSVLGVEMVLRRREPAERTEAALKPHPW